MLMTNYFDSFTCRACLEYTDEMVPIFETNEVMSKSMKLSTLLAECTNIELIEGDEMPKQICNACLNEATRAYTFREKFQKADSFLKSMLENRSKEAIKSGQVNFVTVEVVGNDNENVEILGMNDDENVLGFDEDSIKIEQSVDGDEDQLEFTVIGKDFDSNIGQEDDEEEVHPIQIIVKKKKKRKSNDKTSPTANTKKESGKAQETKNQATKKIYPCEVCDKKLSSKSALQEHLKGHTAQFTCSKCGQKFKMLSALVDHEARHDPNNPNKCKDCGRMFRNREMMDEHIHRVHKQDKPYLCGICGKGFLQKTAFEKHMRIHTGEKPYHCDVCTSKFRYKNSLVLHLRVHTDEKPYPCLECKLRFRDKAHLRKHLLIHSGEKPFKCEYCEKSFNRSSNLNAHRKIHTGERKYVCPVCGKAFIQNNVMQAHVANHNKK